MSNNNTTTVTTETTTTTTEVKFREDLVAFADKIKPQYVVNKEAGSLVLPATVYFAEAPEGITPESYRAHKQYADLFNNGTTKAGSELAIDLFAENKELETVVASAAILDKDTYEATFKRHATGRNPRTKEVSNYVGAISVARINVVSSRTEAEWKGIKANMRSLADAAGL